MINNITTQQSETIASGPTEEEISKFTKTLFKMDPIQLASVSGAALGLAERKARHTVIPWDHWLLKHVNNNHITPQNMTTATPHQVQQPRPKYQKPMSRSSKMALAWIARAGGTVESAGGSGTSALWETPPQKPGWRQLSKQVVFSLEEKGFLRFTDFRVGRDGKTRPFKAMLTAIQTTK